MTDTRSDFWSRRKARVQEEEEADARVAEAEEAAAREAELAEKSDEEILAELELPDPDTLEKGDDFSVFMKQAVPERIRRRALRKLWLSNPLLANLDQLVEYGEDYTDAATVVENLSTTYQVGKGMLAHVMELERQKEEADSAERDESDADEAGEAVVPEAPEERVVAEAPETLVANAQNTVSADPKKGDDETGVLPRRRMRFDFAQ